MSDSPTSFSASIRAHIESDLDQDIDLTQAARRSECVKRYIEKNEIPAEKKQSVSAMFTKQFTKIAKDRQLDPNKFKRPEKMKAKYDSRMNTNITAAPSSVQKPLGGVPIMNPSINPNAPTQTMINQNQIQTQYNITSTQVKAFCDSLYAMIQAFDSDLPDLEKHEAEDLGDLFSPLAQQHIQSERALALFAFGGAAGIIARKVRISRAKKKARKEEKKLKKIEPVSDGGRPILPLLEGEPDEK